jgi:hypothetical protein
MLLPKEFVAYIARQLVSRLSPQTIETTNTHAAAEAISTVIMEELMVEDKLNDEVRGSSANIRITAARG